MFDPCPVGGTDGVGGVGACGVWAAGPAGMAGAPAPATGVKDGFDGEFGAGDAAGVNLGIRAAAVACEAVWVGADRDGAGP